jgi:cytidylate kinase
MDTIINIAIDGPAAAGKSTISRKVAKKLNYMYIDTGAMYRCVTLYTLRHGEDKMFDDLNQIDIRFQNNDSDTQRVILNNEDVTEEIRSKEVTLRVSEISSYEAVRTYLVHMQQQLAKEKGIVMDGRDVGTTVLPDAELKIFMQASPEVRAKRRLLEEIERGNNVDLETLTEQIIQRDTIDMSREISPLTQAEDALLLDTSQMTIDEVENYIVKLVVEKVGGK